MAGKKTSKNILSKRTKIYYHKIIAIIAVLIVSSGIDEVLKYSISPQDNRGFALAIIVGGSVVIGIAIARIKMLHGDK